MTHWRGGLREYEKEQQRNVTRHFNNISCRCIYLFSDFLLETVPADLAISNMRGRRDRLIGFDVPKLANWGRWVDPLGALGTTVCACATLHLVRF